ncbi:MAG: hypothetical protein AB1552_14095 [Nitrospirota bacterium]
MHKVLKGFRGYNDTMDADAVRPYQLAKNSQNVITTDGGLVETRRGLTALGATLGAGAVVGVYRGYMWGQTSNAIFRLGTPLTQDSTPRLVAVGGTTYAAWTGSGWTTLGTVTSGAMPCFETFVSEEYDYIVLTNGTNAPLRWRGQFGTTAATFTAPTQRFAFVQEFQRFLFLLRGQTDPRLMKFSSDADMTNWPAYHEYRIDDAITGVKRFAEALTIHTERAIYTLRGTGIDTFTLTKSIVASGAVAQNTIVETPWGLFYLGAEGPYLWQGGSQAQYLGGAIQSLLADLSFDYRHLSSAALKEGRYIFLSMPIGSSQTSCNRTIRLDLERGIWDAPQTTGFASMSQADRGGDPNRLYAGATTGGKVYILDEGTSDDGVAIDAIAEFVAQVDDANVRKARFRKYRVYAKGNDIFNITPLYRDEIDATRTTMGPIGLTTAYNEQDVKINGAAQGKYLVPGFRCNTLDARMTIKHVECEYEPFGVER